MRFNLHETKLHVSHRLTRLLAVVLGLTVRKVSHVFANDVFRVVIPLRMGFRWYTSINGPRHLTATTPQTAG